MEKIKNKLGLFILQSHHQLPSRRLVHPAANDDIIIMMTCFFSLTTIKEKLVFVFFIEPYLTFHKLLLRPLFS